MKKPFIFYLTVCFLFIGLILLGVSAFLPATKITPYDYFGGDNRILSQNLGYKESLWQFMFVATLVICTVGWFRKTTFAFIIVTALGPITGMILWVLTGIKIFQLPDIPVPDYSIKVDYGYKIAFLGAATIYIATVLSFIKNLERQSKIDTKSKNVIS